MLVQRFAPSWPSRSQPIRSAAPFVSVRRATRLVARAEVAVSAPAPAITLTPEALEHLKKLRADAKAPGDHSLLVLRVGVKQGGCSGMSYVMDFEAPDKITSDDHVMSYDNDGFKLVVDPKSLLYLFGMELGWSSALIGGGFQFRNPNATDSCGCGKSFGV